MAQSKFLSASIDAQKREFGDTNVYVASEGEKLAVGIPLPSFCLMYLLDLDVLPLGRIVGLAGEPASQKSSLGFEIARWISNAGGETKLVECEGGKYSPVLLRSILGEDSYKNHFLIGRADSIEQAQSQMSSVIKLYEKNEEEGAKSISALLVDSMTGVTSDSLIEKHTKEGFASASVAVLAKGWTDYLRSFSSRLAGWPITAVIVNHLKDKVSTTGGPSGKYTPGGDAHRFYSALYLWVTRTNSGSRKTIFREGKRMDRFTEYRTIKIKLKKSSLGCDGRDITVNFCWFHDENGEQVTYFDWPAATCELLLANQSMHSYIDKQPADLCNLLDVTVSEGSGEKKYSSEALGVEGVSDSELGVLIDSNPEWVDKLCTFMHITRHTKWDGEMPELVRERKKAARKSEEKPDKEEGVKSGKLSKPKDLAEDV